MWWTNIEIMRSTIKDFGEQRQYFFSVMPDKKNKDRNQWMEYRQVDPYGASIVLCLFCLYQFAERGYSQRKICRILKIRQI